MSTIPVANFASCLGKYDGGVLVGNASTDVSGLIGTSDVSMSGSGGYVKYPTAFTTPAVGNNTGFSVTGWFYASGVQGSNVYTPIFDMSGASTVATNHVTLCVSGNAVSPLLVANFNGQGTISTAVNTNVWNFFGYTVCCSGGTQLTQSLTVNGTTTSVTGGAYAAMVVANTFVGYGSGATYANYFNGKVDDFRYYGRVVTPMEMNVLYGYAYGKTGLVNPTPTLGTITMNAVYSIGFLPAQPFTFSTTNSLFSYLMILRTLNGVTSTFLVSTTDMTMNPGGTSYTWTDYSVAGGSQYAYVFTPYVMYTAGAMSATYISTMPVLFAVPISNVAYGGISQYAFSAASNGILNGSSTSNGISYNCYAFLNTDKAYTITYSTIAATTMFVLAVGGGGGGAAWGGGGGGGGGVVMMPVMLPSSSGASQTMTINVGAGGGAGVSFTTVNTTTPSNGISTTIMFSANAVLNVSAWGGGAGGPSANGVYGGSGGGGGNSAGIGALSNNTYNNYGNVGGTSIANFSGGGGGAGVAATTGVNAVNGGSGGVGIQCFLPGIATFAPSNVSYGTYYWGGGGGGSATTTTTVQYGNGGLGGGGGGTSQTISYLPGAGGGSALNSGGTGTNSATLATSGKGGANTGGGGGGVWSGTAGAGGSGIVVLAFPQIVVSSTGQAIYTAAQLLDTSFVHVMNTSTLTTSAYNSSKGAFSCKLVNWNYFGPTMTLRDACGNFTQNFYADVFGNLTTGYGNTGINVRDYWNWTNPVPLVSIATDSIPSGWTNNGASISSTFGNPAPSISLTTAYSRLQGLVNINSFLSKIIMFDIYCANLSDPALFFACNSSGVGTGFRLDTRLNAYSGFATTANFGGISAPSSTTGAIYGKNNVWYSIKITINGSGVATWASSTTGQSGIFTAQNPTAGYTITNNGNYMAFNNGDFGPTVYIDNVNIYDSTTSLNTNNYFCYVSKWYNQGMDICFNSATQYTLTSQPIYDVYSQLINFGYTGAGGGIAAPQTNTYFDLPVGALPYGDTSYSYVIRHWNVPSAVNAGFINGGTNDASSKNCLAIRTNATNYYVYWGATAAGLTTTVSNQDANVITTKYATGSTSEPFYINSVLNNTGTATVRTQKSGSNFIGVTNTTTTAPGSEYLNGQLYSIFVYNTSIDVPSQTSTEIIPYVASTLTTWSNNIGYITPVAGSNITISSIKFSWPLANMVNGTSVSNGVTYNVYSFTVTGGSYTVTYSCSAATLIYVLAVGGGGGGGAYGGTAGGAGGVVMQSISLPSTGGASQTMTITVGGGSSGGVSSTAANISNATNGINTTIVFSTNAGLNVTAWGGGAGLNSAIGVYGGSGGGGGTGGYIGGLSNNNSNNYGNSGGTGNGNFAGGGGGAGACGATGVNVVNGGSGGNGIQCFLPGIATFAPSGVSYSTYYWGGGGGGSTYNGGTVQYGNGGLGGGGGGTSQNISYLPGAGGGSALNSGRNGTNAGTTTLSSGGSGGTNTGGGGGGVWYGTAGTGGSGIVVLAFPTTVVTSNSQAILTYAQISRGMYKDVMTMQGVTSPAYQSIKGGFACRLINYDYFGPVMTLRHSADGNGNYTQNFYSDVLGYLGTGYLGTGMSVNAWLAANNGANPFYAYVTKWYNQGMDICFNSATQYTLGSQPIYDVDTRVLNFGYQGTEGGVAAPQASSFLNLPNSAYPVTSSTTTDCSYTYVVRHGNYSSTQGMALFSGGSNTATSNANAILLNYGSAGQYYNWWQGADYQLPSGSMAPKNVISTTFASTGTITFGTRAFYVNGTSIGIAAVTEIHKQLPTLNYIGSGTHFPTSQFQMYDFFVFSTAIATNDRLAIEATPTEYIGIADMTYTAPGGGSNVSINSIKATKLAFNAASLLSGTSVTNGITYSCYAFLDTSYAYVLTYTCVSPTTMFVLAVGGGGGGAACGGQGGGSGGSGGGGAGGVVMIPMVLPSSSQSQTMTIMIGTGGIYGTSPDSIAPNTRPNNGNNTTIIFSANAGLNVTAWGGGAGGSSTNGMYGGSGGGGGGNTCIGGLLNNTYYNYGNNGGAGIPNLAGGGGGAGSAAAVAINTTFGGSGGNGIQCFLPGIADFAPSGVSYSTYYWGGGGGGSSYNISSYGNGGWGGGGGGTGSTSSVLPGTGGGSALNSGRAGTSTLKLAGNGGANTGGGGGAAWWGTGGSGGSGIVVLAFPKTVLASAGASVYNTTQLADPSFVPVMNTSALTTSAYTLTKGAFSCKLVNWNYFGPTMTLRNANDTTGLSTTNFYADVFGNMYTNYGNTGLPVKDWLAGTTYAFVSKWYNQGMDICFNSATQYTMGSQPIYDVSNQVLNFGDTNAAHGVGAPQNGWFNLPNGAYPLSPTTTTDCSYAFVVRHGYTNSASTMTLFSGGTSGTNISNALVINNSANNYYIWWGNNDLTGTTANLAANNVVSSIYSSTGTTATMGTRTLYVNGNANGSGNTGGTAGIHQQNPTNNFIGNCTVATVYAAAFQFQMYDFFFFGNYALTQGTDRQIIEGTPYVSSSALITWSNDIGYITPIAGSNITISSIKFTWSILNMVKGTSVSNGVTYKVYSFTVTGGSYTVTYSCTTTTLIYVLAVGGGGGGGNNAGSGGGAGGVVMQSVTLYSGTNQTITVTLGAGGLPSRGSNTSGGVVGNNGANGGNTTVNFSANTSANITAWGGGAGVTGYTSSVAAGYSGGSGGGGVTNGTTNYSGGLPINQYNNYGNIGGSFGAQSYTIAGAGGGAGTTGTTTMIINVGGNGGNGIQCFLPGIQTFAPSGTTYGSYYWGGGGGGAGAGAGGDGAGGGLGGGGAGGGTSTNNNLGGGSALNPGGNGMGNTATASAGSGGANTGGGGGGGWNYIAGTGGSGIVVIAFPTTVVTSNYQAVIPAAQVTAGMYPDTFSTVSAVSSGAIKGGFACRLLNYNYFGPIMTLRYNNDVCGNYTTNFYADVCGNLGTQYLGTGTSVLGWLYNAGANTSYAYVSKWYNQGMDVCFNSATQYSLGSQPIYDVVNAVINFGYQGTGGGVLAPQTGSYLNLPNGALPFGDSAYTYTTKHWNTQSTLAPVVSGGTGATNKMCVGIELNRSTGYGQEWYNTLQSGIGAVAPNNVVSSTYIGGGGASSGALYVNSGSATYWSPGTVRSQDMSSNTIGNSIVTSWGFTANHQIYYLYYFSSAIAQNDRLAIEATDTTLTLTSVYSLVYTAPPAGSNVLISSITYPLNQPSTLVSGTSTTNGVTYNCFAFLGAGLPYKMMYTCAAETTMFVLAVGGGGGGASFGGGGGGAGGVVMMPILLPSSSGSSQTMTINVGGGGVAGLSSTTATIVNAINGSNTTIVFSANASLNVTAWGGGEGGPSGVAGSYGGSGGGGGNVTFGGLPNNIYNNYGNVGGTSISNFCGGGGGAGAAAATGINATNGGSGGNGIQCFLPGIANFSPSGTLYGTYYWGGGGGGGANTTSTVQYGNGGWGGGGGGTSMITSVLPGAGGSSALTTGGTGTNSATLATSGNGGANTGGGGGGAWWGTAGSGGSGIVVLAFPQSVLASAGASVYNSAQLTDASYTPVMNSSTLTTAAYSSVKGGFSCKLVNWNYFGPTMTLRYFNDLCGNYTQNFYADVFGNMYTGYGNTGIPVKEWLNANSPSTPTYAFVSKWYNQGMDICFNSATQYVLSTQPIYDTINQLLNFGDTNAAHGVVAPQNGWFNLPDGAYPLSPSTSTDCSTAYVVRHGNTNSSSLMILFSGGVNNSYQATGLVLNNTSYLCWSSVDDLSSTASRMAANNVLTWNYVSTGTSARGMRTLYVNGTADVSGTIAGIHQQNPTANYIGYTTVGYAVAFQFQMYDFFFFGNYALTQGTDRQIIEGTPYITSSALTTWSKNIGYVAPVAGSNVTISSIKFSWPIANMVNGTSVSNGITYNVYSFTVTGGSYVVTYSCSAATLIYVLAVGGGGGGAAWGGSGGGAGGVVMMPVSLPSGTGQTITVTVGAGGGAGVSSNSANTTNPTNGTNTTIVFNANAGLNVTAWGGGAGGPSANGVYGGSGGGGGNPTWVGGLSNNTYNNYGNVGGTSISGFSSGGGGAGAAAATGVNATNGGSGGNGIQCVLPGISTFAPSNVSYGTYYWGGGGGGASYYALQYGNGGLGGGGGGTSTTTSVLPGTGGGSALTTGGTGTNSTSVTTLGTSGYGGANTGGGGGGLWYGTGGSGGSGIVVIAFPQIAVTSNSQAVLTSTQISSGAYKDVLTMQGLTSPAYQSIKGGFACRLINYDYFGPIMTLRHSADACGNYTANFYADVCGNLGTGYLGTGTSVMVWLAANVANPSYAYVTKWYNQGMDISFNSATQYKLSSQPIYDVANGLINFGYTGTTNGSAAAPQTNCFFNLPNGAAPYGDASYSYTTALGYTNLYAAGTANVYASVLTFGSGYARRGYSLEIINNIYQQEWYTNGALQFSNWNGSTGKTVISTQYTSGGGNIVAFANNSTATPTSTMSPGTTRIQDSCSNTIGANISTNWTGNGAFNGQMYNMYMFQNVISTNDRALVETTATNRIISIMSQFSITVSSSGSIYTIVFSAVDGTTNYDYQIFGNTLTPSSVSINNNIVTAIFNISNIVVLNTSNIFVVAYNSFNNIIGFGIYTPPCIITYGGSIQQTYSPASNGIISGASIISNVFYNCYAFLNTSATYNLYYSSSTSKTIYILTVGGGGAGDGAGDSGGGGGGAGGVVMSTILLSSGSQTITINVGAGGSGLANNTAPTPTQKGRDTTVTFSINSSSNITAWGGGYGGSGQGPTPANVGGQGGSGGGGSSGASGAAAYNNSAGGFYTGVPGSSNNTLNNYGNSGGQGYATSVGYAASGGGGGGAGGVGNSGAVSGAAGNGGIGIKCTLGVINNFTPSGYSSLGTYYWGGGGAGGASTFTTGGSVGGLGGGGGAFMNNYNYAGAGGGSALNSGTGGMLNATGSGGANTGGGGGGGGGNGGSGIVVIAIPSDSVTVFSANGTITPSTTKTAQILLVGGGGGGGAGGFVGGTYSGGGGGGGGGGVGVGTITLNAGITYTINVGTGGAGSSGLTTAPFPGTQSSIVGGSINEIAYGGGSGGYSPGPSNASTAGNGGSGGGTFAQGGYGGSAISLGTLLTYYGNNGGYSSTYGQSTGGGGATSAGYQFGGGQGYTWSNTNTVYGSGGGAGATNSSGGGGGSNAASGTNGSNASPAPDGYGGGGGGGGTSVQNGTVYSGSRGGNGIVIIAYN